MNFNRTQLALVARGQQKRNKSIDSINQYLSKMKVLTNLLNSIIDLREEALILNNNGQPSKHLGGAKNIFKLRLPISMETAQLLFACSSSIIK